MQKVNFNPQGTLIQDEALFVPPQSHITGTKFKLSHDVFSSVDFSITYNGETLVPQVDYVLTDVYERARQEMGLTVYQRVQFLPNAPLGFTSTVYVTYRAVGDFVDADNFLSVSDNDDRYCKRSNNLSDVATPQTALKNLEDAASTTTDADDFGYDSTNQSSQSDVMVLTKWGGGIPFKVPFKEFSEAVHDAVGDPLPIDKGGTNAQDADNAILNLIQGATSIRDDATRDDTEIPCFTGSAYAQGSNFGKVSLLKIFNNWLKSKFQSWLGITVTESGGSITGRSFDGNAARTSNAITFSNDGAGAASGSTFDGSAARKLSYNSIGAAAAKDVYAFTYIVDSDEKLADWANNVVGNDYTSVLIKKGTYELSTGINLTNTGTKVIVGEVGSKLIFNSYGFSYNSTPQTNDYFIKDVTIESTHNASDTAVFIRCRNLINCSVNSALNIGFYSCKKLYNCYVNISTSRSNVKGFDVCENLYDCEAYVVGAELSYGFRACSNLINCIGRSTSNVNSGIAFETSNYLFNCYGYGDGVYGDGFALCNNLTNCKGKGIGSSNGYGYFRCYSVRYSVAEQSTTQGFSLDSYSSPIADSTYLCANTLNGGWNGIL